MSKREYLENLPDPERKRYLEKLNLINGADPYTIPKAEWSAEATLLPAVSYPDIVNYLVFNSSLYTMDDLKAYKGLEAYNFFVSGWVRQPMVAIRDELHVVAARVLHSQRVKDTSASSWIIAEKEGKVLAGHCDCMAGLGEVCSHVAALLFLIEATVRIRDSKTVTQEKAYWKLPGPMRELQYRPIKDIGFMSAKSKKLKLDHAIDSSCSQSPRTLGRSTSHVDAPTQDSIAAFYKALSDCPSKPAILSLISPYSNQYTPKTTSSTFPKCLSDLHDKACQSLNHDELLIKCASINISVTEDQVKKVEAETRGQASSKLWYRYRASRITASRFGQVCKSKINKLSQSLIKAICYPELCNFKSDATSWGCGHEKVARARYETMMSELHTNFSISDSGFWINTEHPFIGATPDGQIICDCCGAGVLEIKCPFCQREKNLMGEDEGGVKGLVRGGGGEW